jgi:hypothetical protein
MRPPSTLSASAVELRTLEQPPSRRLALFGLGAAALVTLGVVIGAVALSGPGVAPVTAGPAGGTAWAESAEAAAAAPAAATAGAGVPAAATAARVMPAAATAAVATAVEARAPAGTTAEATAAATAAEATAAGTAAEATAATAATAGAAATAKAVPKGRDLHKTKKAPRSAAPDDYPLPD